MVGLTASSKLDQNVIDGHWCPVDGLIVEQIGDEVLVLDKRRGRIHQFNHTAAIVWRGLIDGQTIDQIVLTIAECYDVPDFRARKDAVRMLEQLQILKLVERGVAEQAPPIVEKQ